MVLGHCLLGPLLIDGSRFNHAAVRRVPRPAVATADHTERAAADAGVAASMDGEPVVRFEDGKHKVALYVPRTVEVHEGRFDLVIHFHGPHDRTRAALDHAELGAVMVSLNLGEGGATYEDAAASSDFLARVVAFAEHGVNESRRLPGGRAGRIAISSWSAGFGAVREIMRRPGDAARVDGLLLADGLFTDWNASRDRAHPRNANLDKVAGVMEFARRAIDREKLFVLTHSAIPRREYADAPDIAGAMIEHFNLEKEFPDEPVRSPSQPPNYSSDSGSLHIWCFGGKTWADHLAQHDALRKHFAALKAFWYVGRG